MRNHSYENDFDLRKDETACKAHFHVKGFVLISLGLKKKHKRTGKWPIAEDEGEVSLPIKPWSNGA